MAVTVDLAASLLNVTATALRKGDVDEDLMRDCRSAIREAEDRLRELLKRLNNLTEADYELLILADHYRSARDLYLPLVDDERACGPEEKQFYRAVDSLLRYQCLTVGGVHIKARLFLENQELFDILANTVNHAAVKEFLGSLACEGGAA